MATAGTLSAVGRTDIRPLGAEDLPAVARLVQQGFANEAERPIAEVAAFLAATTLESPWHDPELPSLVAVDPEGEPIGFIAVHPRRMLLADRAVRAAWCSHLVVDQQRPGAGLGMQL